MDLTPYIEGLQRDLAATAAPGGPDVTRAAELLTGSIEASARLCLLEALSDAAAEITTKLGTATVDVRLRGREADLIVTELAPPRRRTAPRRPAPSPTPPATSPGSPFGCPKDSKSRPSGRRRPKASRSTRGSSARRRGGLRPLGGADHRLPAPYAPAGACPASPKPVRLCHVSQSQAASRPPPVDPRCRRPSESNCSTNPKYKYELIEEP